APAPKRPSARVSFTPTCSAASSAPRSSTGKSCSTSVRGPRPKKRKRFASKARTTKCRTATCWRSASTCNAPAPLPGERVGVYVHIVHEHGSLSCGLLGVDPVLQIDDNRIASDLRGHRPDEPVVVVVV